MVPALPKVSMLGVQFKKGSNMKHTTQDLVHFIKSLQTKNTSNTTCHSSKVLNTSILAESLVKEVSGGKIGSIEVFGKWSRS